MRHYCQICNKGVSEGTLYCGGCKSDMESAQQKILNEYEKRTGYVNCSCGGQSFLNKPELHDKNCPIYIYYYYKTGPKSINYYPQSVAPDSYYKPDFYKEKANKELQDIARAKQRALENFLAQQIPASVTITKSEPDPKKKEQIEIEKPKKRVIDFD